MLRNGDKMPGANAETQATCLNTRGAYVRCSMQAYVTHVVDASVPAQFNSFVLKFFINKWIKYNKYKQSFSALF